MRRRTPRGFTGMRIGAGRAGGSCGGESRRLQGSARSRIRSCGFSICAKPTEWSSGESNPARVGASHRSSPSEPRKSDRRGSNPVRSAGNAVCFRPDTTVACRERPERESNPRHRCERPASCPARRPGREHGRKESNPLASVLETEWTPCLVRVELLGRDSNHASFGSEPKILPLDDRGTKAATAGVEPAFPG